MKQLNSELAKNILRSPEGQKLLGQVSPIYENGRIGLWLFQVIGRELDELVAWIRELAMQAYPQTATWSLDTWEQQYGLPSGEGKPPEERREAITTTIRERASMTPYKITRLISALCDGIGVRIVENTAVNTFGVYLDTLPGNIEELAVRRVINRCKPAHLGYELGYEQAAISLNYCGILMQTAKKLEIRQVN